MTRLQIQSLAQAQPPQVLAKFLSGLLKCQAPTDYQIRLCLGDLSGIPLLDAHQVAEWADQFSLRSWEFNYIPLETEAGFSQAQAALLQRDQPPDRLLVLSPQVVVPFHLLARLNELADNRADWGAIEARQIPLEQSKKFNNTSLETGWVGFAATLYDVKTLGKTAGFDGLFKWETESAALDLSWRIRASGRKLYYAASTFIFTNRTIEPGRQKPIITEIGQQHEWLSRLILQTKYGRADLTGPLLQHLANSPGNPYYASVLVQWNELRSQVEQFAVTDSAVDFFEEEQLNFGPGSV